MLTLAMSSSGFAELIEIRTAKVPRMAAYAAGMVLLAIGAASMADLPALSRTAVLIISLAGIAANVTRHWRSPDRLRRAVLSTDGTWQLFLNSGRPIEARLIRAWGRSAGPIIALEWRSEAGRRVATWLWRADIAPVTWRRLRVRLRLA
jgi:hypothetical protein